MSSAPAGPPERLETGIAGLDVILEGGWPRGGSYLVHGDAGVGKTTVGLQFLMRGAAGGERCVVVTLSESEAELRQVGRSHGWDLDGIQIVDLSTAQAAAGDEADYSVFAADEVELNETMERIRDAVKRIQPHRVVLDPFSGIRMLSGNPTRYRQRLHGFKTFLWEKGVTALIVSDTTRDEMQGYLETAVRGVLFLRQTLGEYGDTRRYLTIQKLRGSTHQTGEHPFRIEPGGLVVFPQLPVSASKGERAYEILGSGVEGLDKMLGGGIERGSATIISGQSGVGKTTLGLHFLTRIIGPGERAHVFSLDEGAASMRHRGHALGIPVSELVREGRVEVERIRSTQMYPAEFAAAVQRAVDGGARAVLIDSVTGYRAGVTGKAHLAHHLIGLLDHLAQEGVTTLLTIEDLGDGFSVADPFGLSYLADNIVLLRFFEAGGRVRRAINVLRKRMGSHESAIREFQLTSEGIRIGPSLNEFHGVLGKGAPEYVGAERELLPEGVEEGSTGEGSAGQAGNEPA